MNLSAPFINRPIATTLLAIGLAIAGLVAFKLLPVSSLPQIEFPTIMVQANLPGANPDTMATAVATPLERQFGRIAGITEMTSSSTLGSARVTIQFDLSRNIDGAARDVQAAINAARSQLPTNLPSNPIYRKINPADAPIMIIALTSDNYSKAKLYDFASTILQQKLSQVEGIGQVFVGGGSLSAVRVELNPTVLSNYNIGFSTVRDTLANANANLAKGQLSNKSETSEIYTNDQIFKAYQYRPLIVVYRNSLPVRLSALGRVEDSVENILNAGLSNGKPAIVLILSKQPGANVIETIDRIRALMPILKASIPTAINMSVVMDRTNTIRASLHDVEATLLIALGLVIAVTYIFLGNIRSMLVPAVAVPLSIIGTFIVMRLLNYTLDNLSLMALTISTGFVIDDAIVVLENISRHIELGSKPMAAALQGAKEVGFTVVSMSLSLIAVFIPILLMEGIVGRLFREFTVTLSVAILISLVVSLTVTPMMCAFVLKPTNKKDKNFLTDKINKIYRFYAWTLNWSLQHSALMLVMTLFAIVLNIYLFVIVPKGFFPQQDTGRITGSIQGAQNISFQAMQRKLVEYITAIKNDPAVENVAGFVGGGNTTNTGNLFISLKDLADRKKSVDQILGRLREKVKTVTGSALYMQAAQDIVIGGRSAQAQFQYTLTADNLNDLNTWTPMVMAKLLKLPGIADINSDQLNNGLQVMVEVDRDAAKRFGITSQQIDNTLYSAFGQSQVSIMYMAMNQYHVVMEVAPEYWQYPSTLNKIYVTSSAGKEIPLAFFAHFVPSSTLLSVNHQSQAPAATLSFNLLPGYALGDAVKKVGDAVDAMHLPPTVRGAFRGTAQAFQASLASEPYLILLALIAIYIVLGILYESFIHPITILSTLPSAGVGAILALLLTGTDLSLIAFIGIILLIGIVKKNAIMMIDVALQVERTDNKTSRDAIYEAALLRFRPIMMTTMAAMLGALPLAIGFGVGSEMRRPLGIAIIGGLIVSQMLTLYTTPVIYLWLEKVGDWFKSFRTYGSSLSS